MLAFSPQINNVSLTTQANGLQDTGGQSSGTSGSFMSILSSIINSGGEANSIFIDQTNTQGNPLQMLLQKLQGPDGIIDPLMLSFIQQLIANPQVFQEALNCNIIAGDNNLDLIAQLNPGQIKELADFVKNLGLNQAPNQSLTVEHLQEAIKNLTKDSFQDDLRGIKDSTLTTVTNTTNTDELAISKSPSVLKLSSKEGIELNQSAIPTSYFNAVNNLAKASLVQDNKAIENLNPLITKDNIDEANKFLSKNMDNPNMTIKTVEQELSQLFNNEIVIEEVQSGLHQRLNNDLNQNIESPTSTRVEATQLGTTNNAQQGTHIRNEQPVKEVVHISRLQEIDSKIFKAIETGHKTLTVRLEPPELGTVHIKLVLTDGMLRADMKVDNIAVKDMMNLALPQIRNSLENAGIKVSEFFVDIREEYYSDGRQHQKDNDTPKDQKEQKRQKDEEIKPFEFYI